MKKTNLIISIIILIIIFIVFQYTNIEQKKETTINQNEVKDYKDFDFKNSYKTLDFVKNPGNMEARKILFNFLSDDIKRLYDNSIFNEFSLDDVCADFIDLDDDGIDEVIGFTFHPYGAINCGGSFLFVLQKQKDDSYKKINRELCEFDRTSVFISKEKTGKHRNMIFYYMPCKRTYFERRMIVYKKERYNYRR